MKSNGFLKYLLSKFQLLSERYKLVFFARSFSIACKYWGSCMILSCAWFFWWFNKIYTKLYFTMKYFSTRTFLTKLFEIEVMRIRVWICSICSSSLFLAFNFYSEGQIWMLCWGISSSIGCYLSNADFYIIFFLRVSPKLFTVPQCIVILLVDWVAPLNLLGVDFSIPGLFTFRGVLSIYLLWRFWNVLASKSTEQ